MLLMEKENIRYRVAPTADVFPPERSRFDAILLTTNVSLLVGMCRSLLFSIHPRNWNTCFASPGLHRSGVAMTPCRDVYAYTNTRPAHYGFSFGC